MAGKRETVDEKVARLNALRVDPGTPAARELLAQALAAAQGALVAAAANIVAAAELDGFERALSGAFERMLERGAKADPGCHAKTAAARALYRTGAAATGEFLRGVRCVQREPVWGGTQDTAVELRGVCALGLVRGGYPDAIVELAELLADPEPMARVAAAQAIAYSERADLGVPLLRLKARLGDTDPRVTSACLGALLGLAPERSLEFVAGFAAAQAPAEQREAAWLALGESRLPAALPVLQQAAEEALGDERGVVLIAIALMRSEAAWQYLVTLVREGSEPAARAAIDAIATYRDDAALCERVLAAAAARDDGDVSAYAQRVLARR
jgi:hypothetical protein